MVRDMLWWFQSFYWDLFYSPIYGFSWRMLHVHLRGKCILLLGDVLYMSIMSTEILVLPKFWWFCCSRHNFCFYDLYTLLCCLNSPRYIFIDIYILLEIYIFIVSSIRKIFVLFVTNLILHCWLYVAFLTFSESFVVWLL